MLRSNVFALSAAQCVRSVSGKEKEALPLQILLWI